MPPEETGAESADARALLAEALWDDPETRPDMERIIKKKFPKAPIPSFDVRQEGEKTLAEIRKEREAITKLTDEARQRQALDAERRKIMNDPDLRIGADEIPAIEALMQEQLIGTHTAAARLYRAQQRVAAPRADASAMEVPGVMGAGGDEFKTILTDPQWGRKKAHEVLNEFNRTR